MKKGNTTLEQLLRILADEALCKQLLNGNDNCSFLSDGLSRQYYLNEFDRLLNNTVFIMKKNRNFRYFPLVMKLLNRFYVEKMKQNPFEFYENSACRNLLELFQEYPAEMKQFEQFLLTIEFEKSKDEIGRFYHKQMKKNRILNDFELKDLLNYLMIYKNRRMPHHYLRYLFYVIFKKSHQFELTPMLYAELFRFLILDLLEQLKWDDKVHIVSLQEPYPFIYQGSDMYINVSFMKATLEKNLPCFVYLFDLFEKRYKYKSLVHNKYEEIKNKKQDTMKEMLGASFFYDHYSYLSMEQDIVNRGLIARLRFLEDIDISLYQQIIEDYEKNIIQSLQSFGQVDDIHHLVLTLEELTDQTILLAPEVVTNQPYLQIEYRLDGSPKSIAQVVASYEESIKLCRSNADQEHQVFIYYEQVILNKTLNFSKLADEFVAIMEYPIQYSQTDFLIERVFCEYFVRQINNQIQNHILNHQELELILSKLNQYLLKFYQVEQTRISKLAVKDPKKWKLYSEHLIHLYHFVEYMSRPSLYESSYLNLTHVLDLSDAKAIQKKALQKKIVSQRIYMIVLIVLILIFSTSLFLLGRIFWQYWNAKDSYGKIQKQMNQVKPVPIIVPDPNRTEFPINDDIPQMDFDPLKKENEEVVAWIRIEGTAVNYPVVQGTDNEYYLSHLYNKKYNISGSIFGDYRNNIDFSSDNMVLYGHNMKNGSMFGSLKKYKDQKYVEEHPYIWFITPKATYQYEIYAAYEFNSLKEQYIFNFNSDESFQEYLEKVKQKSIISSDLDVEVGDHILTLSTCTEEPSHKRFTVVAKRMVTYVVTEDVSN